LERIDCFGDDRYVDFPWMRSGCPVLLYCHEDTAAAGQRFVDRHWLVSVIKYPEPKIFIGCSGADPVVAIIQTDRFSRVSRLLMDGDA
jgi:hypothetical protein